MRVTLDPSLSATPTGGKLPLLLMVLVTVLFSLFIAFTTKPVADFLYVDIARLDDPALNALEFALYPLALALAVILWRPGFYGVQIGQRSRTGA